MKRLEKLLMVGTVVPSLLIGQMPAFAQTQPAAPQQTELKKPKPEAGKKPEEAKKPAAAKPAKPAAEAPAKPTAPAKPAAAAPAKPAAAAPAKPAAAAPAAPAPAATPKKPVAAEPAKPATTTAPAKPVPGVNPTTSEKAPKGAKPGAAPAATMPQSGVPAAGKAAKPGQAAPAPAAVAPAPQPGVPAAGQAAKPGQAAPATAAPAPLMPTAPGNAKPVGGPTPSPVPPPVTGGPDPMPQPPVRQGGGVGVGVGIGVGIGVGVVGGAILSNQMHGVAEVQTHRQTVVEGGVTYVREPGRVIVREPGAPVVIVHDENERFVGLGYKPQVVREGTTIRTVYDRPDGTRIITVTDEQGRLIRRIRRWPDGREVIIIDNAFRPRPPRIAELVVTLPPPPLTIPRERYIVDASTAEEGAVFEALTAPPLAPVKRRYTLDEVRYSPDLRAQMRSVDVNTITFDTGSWEIGAGQAQRLSRIAAAINRAVKANPEEVFLVEGHTDAVGSPDDNLSLSDRRAQSVAEILSKDFQVPAENLTTQGYGETQLRVQTDGAARENRRVTIRRITPLIAESGQAK